MTDGFILDHNVIEYPTDFSVEEFDIEYSDRVASGKMVTDVIATKRKFYLDYAYPTIEEITIFATIRAKRDFVDFTFVYLGKAETVSVWMHPVSYTGLHQIPESWTDLRITLEEQ